MNMPNALTETLFSTASNLQRQEREGSEYTEEGFVCVCHARIESTDVNEMKRLQSSP